MLVSTLVLWAFRSSLSMCLLQWTRHSCYTRAFIYLFVWKPELQKEGPDQAKTNSTKWVSFWVAGTQVLGPSAVAAFPGPLAGSWSESGAAGTQSATHIDCHVTGGMALPTTPQCRMHERTSYLMLACCPFSTLQDPVSWNYRLEWMISGSV